MSEINKVKVKGVMYDIGGTGSGSSSGSGSGGGTTVVANPTLVGTEANLTGLQVGEQKYKVPEGGSGEVVKLPTLLGIKPLIRYKDLNHQNLFINPSWVLSTFTQAGIDTSDVILDTSLGGKTIIKAYSLPVSNFADETYYLMRVVLECADKGRDFSILIDLGMNNTLFEKTFSDDTESWFPSGYNGQLTYAHLLEICNQYLAEFKNSLIMPNYVNNCIEVERNYISDFEFFVLPESKMYAFLNGALQPGGSSSSSSSGSSE